MSCNKDERTFNFASCGGFKDKSVIVWEVSNDKTYIMKVLKDHSDCVRSLVYFQDKNENLLVSCGKDENIILWDIKSGEKKATLPKKHNSDITNIIYGKRHYPYLISW